MLFANHLHERQPRIYTRRNNTGVDLIAVFEYDAGCASTLEQNLCNRRFSANLNARFPRCISNRI